MVHWTLNKKFKTIHFMAAFWAVFTFGGSGPALTAHGSLGIKQEIQNSNSQSYLYNYHYSYNRTWFIGH
jgi:hypothetical protein